MMEQNQKRMIGLTGGIGSGKSRILDLLRQEYGARVIQTDRVARELKEPGRAGHEALVTSFGKEILGEDGRLREDVLARMVFGSAGDRDRINRLIHPLVWDVVGRWAREPRQAQCPLLVVESALLPENPGDFFHEIWYVYTSREERIRRLMESRGYVAEMCRQMMAGQPPEEEYRRYADHIIDNNDSLEDVRAQIAEMIFQTRDGQ